MDRLHGYVQTLVLFYSIRVTFYSGISICKKGGMLLNKVFFSSLELHATQRADILVLQKAPGFCLKKECVMLSVN